MGGTIYTLAHLAVLWEDASLIDEAKALATDVPVLSETDKALDVIGGSAGAIAVLEVLNRISASDHLLECCNTLRRTALATAAAQSGGMENRDRVKPAADRILPWRRRNRLGAAQARGVERRRAFPRIGRIGNRLRAEHFRNSGSQLAGLPLPAREKISPTPGSWLPGATAHPESVWRASTTCTIWTTARRVRRSKSRSAKQLDRTRG